MTAAPHSVQPGTASLWQPIETAPKDGTAIWLLLNGWPYIGFGETADGILEMKDKWFVKASFRRRVKDDQRPDEIFGTWDYDVHPTHWQHLPEPLPPPPEAI